MNNVFRPIIFYLFLLSVLVSTNLIFGQTSTVSMFQVIHLPRKTNYSKDKLNAELAILKDKEAVRKLLKLKNFPPQTTILIQISNANNQSVFWTINASTQTDKEDNSIILQSRDNSVTRFYKLSDFKTLFRDTLVIIDTLKVGLFIKDDDYPDDSYVIASLCSKKSQKNRIPVDNGNLIITKGLINNCSAQPIHITLYNSTNQERIIAECKLTFLGSEEQEMLLELASFIKTQTPDKSLKDISFLVSVYAENNFGKIYFPQLTDWLRKNM